MKPPVFAVDFDGTLVEDDKYPDIGEWLPGAANAIRELERHGRVVVFSCRTAPVHHNTEEPRDEIHIDHGIWMMQRKLAEEGLGHLEIWTKPYKPPATVYIDNKGISFRGDWNKTMEDIYDLITPMTKEEPQIQFVHSNDEIEVPWGDFPYVPSALDERERPITTSAEVGPFGNADEYPEDLFDDTEPVCRCDLYFDRSVCACGSMHYYYSCGNQVDACAPDLECEPVDGFGPSTRHPSSQRFHEILTELGALHDEKSKGYGTDEDPFANVRGSEEWGVEAWIGGMIRGTDKIRRLQTFARKGELPFEAVEDAFRDLAVYCVISLVLFEQEQSNAR